MSRANPGSVDLNPGDLGISLGDWTAASGTLHHLLADRLRHLADRGQLARGTRLPPERALAEAIGVSRTTVVAAYGTLKAEGRLTARQGSGTYVAGPGGASGGDDAVLGALARSQLFAALGDDAPGTIDLAAAVVPAAACVAECVPDPGEAASLCASTGYVPAGLGSLRAAVAERYSASGLPTVADQILVTAGAQQAISLVAALYLGPGEPVVVDQPTFPGALDAFRATGARLLSMPVDGGGARIDVLERIVRRRTPHLVYLVATNQNPVGSVLTAARRERLAALSAAAQIPVVDDMTVADLTHDDGRLPLPVAAYAPDAPVITIGSMSKLFWGGLRIGWIRAAEPVVSRLRRFKVIADLGSPLLEQTWALRLLSRFDEARAERGAQLREQCRVLEERLGAALPSWRWASPAGGLALWVQVPGDTRALASAALSAGTRIVPGPQFCADDSGTDHLRLPFTQPPEVLVEGVRRLARAWHELEHEPPRPPPAVVV